MTRLYVTENTERVLDWNRRNAIAIGTAKGLRFLHEECRGSPIIHRDIRASNILLKRDFVPLVNLKALLISLKWLYVQITLLQRFLISKGVNKKNNSLDLPFVWIIVCSNNIAKKVLLSEMRSYDGKVLIWRQQPLNLHWNSR